MGFKPFISLAKVLTHTRNQESATNWTQTCAVSEKGAGPGLANHSSRIARTAFIRQSEEDPEAEGSCASVARLYLLLRKSVWKA